MEKWDTYLEPELTKKAVFTLTQTYCNFLHSIHRAKVAARERDVIIRGEEALPVPDSSDLIPPSVTHCIVESGSRRLYGINPENSILFPRPLEYDVEVDWKRDFESSTLAKSALSQQLDLFKTLTNILEKGTSYGLTKLQLRELIIQFAASHLSSFHPILMAEKDPREVFRITVGLINGNNVVENLRTQIGDLKRSPGNSLSEMAMLMQGLVAELYQAENPFEEPAKRKTRAENYVARNIAKFVERETAEELRALKSTYDSRNEHLNLSRIVEFLTQIETKSQFALKSTKFFPKEAVNAVSFLNKFQTDNDRRGSRNFSQKYDMAYGNNLDKGETYRGREEVRSYRDRQRSPSGERRPWQEDRNGFGRSRSSSPGPAWRGRRESQNLNRAGRSRDSSPYWRNPGKEGGGRSKPSSYRRDFSRSPSRERAASREGSNQESRRPAGRSRSPAPGRKNRSRSPSTERKACFKCGSPNHLQSGCPVYPGERTNTRCPHDGLYHPQSECRYAPGRGRQRSPGTPSSGAGAGGRRSLN